ncbi:MAG: hypothetical protein QOH03_714 [Kribbellaceae bacterium]|jgi:hypothetical protein|nr:hypothetical protein [Kribbellaceae bacterium]
MGAVFGWGPAGHAFEGVAEGALGAVAESLTQPAGRTVVGGNHRPEGLDEEHLRELVAHGGGTGFGVRELLAEKLKQWAESGSRPVS